MDYTLSNQVTWLPNQGWDSRIHIAANGDLVHVFVVITTRYVILVDTLLNPTTANVLVEHAQPDLQGRQLLVVNSHADWDHAWGNQLFDGPTARYPAPIIAHTNGNLRFQDDDTLATLQQMQRQAPTIFDDVQLTAPTLTFSDQMMINGGDLTLHLFPTPGHTTDHIAIYIPEIRTLLSGDAAEIPFPIVHNSMNLPTLRASLATMAQMNAETVLYCHAPPTIGPRLLHDNIAYYDALEAACRTALARSLDTDAIPNSELPASLGCEFADAAPTTGAWEEVSPHARTERHAQQLRLMLAWLQEKELVIREEF
jgi:glyoxylase-like metal-dependent hydrolase (beta-lactamase superfamily II)